MSSCVIWEVWFWSNQWTKILIDKQLPKTLKSSPSHAMNVNYSNDYENTMESFHPWIQVSVDLIGPWTIKKLTMILLLLKLRWQSSTWQHHGLSSLHFLTKKEKHSPLHLINNGFANTLVHYRFCVHGIARNPCLPWNSSRYYNHWKSIR